MRKGTRAMFAFLFAMNFLHEFAGASVWPSELRSLEVELKKGSEKQRVRAAQKIATVDSSAARGVLELALGDSSRAVRLAAARGATIRGAVGLGNAVEGWLKDREPEAKILAVRLMIRDIDEPQLRQIGGLLADSERTVRQAVAVELGRVPERYGSLAASLLLPGLGDSDAAVRREVAASLGRVGTANESLSVAARLSDSEAEVRIQVALALGVIGDVAAVPALLVALSDPEDEVVRAVAHALGRLKSPSAVAGLVSVVRREPVRSAGRAAVEALARIGTVASRQALFAELGRPGMQRTVVEVLKSQLGGRELERCVDNAAAEELSSCLELKIAASGSVEVALRAADDGRIRVEQALSLMRESGDEEAAVFALEHLLDKEHGRRAASLRFLASRKALPHSVAAPVELALKSRAWTIPETRTLLEVLALCRSSHSVRTAARYLESTNPTIRAAAVRVMVRGGAAGEDLSRLLLDSRPEVKGATLRALFERTTPDQAQAIVELLVEGKIGLRRELLRSLWTAPSGLAERTLDQLEKLLEGARGGERDHLISAFAQNGSERRVVRLATSASDADQLKWVQNARFHESGVALARALARGNSRVRAMALRILGRRGNEQDVSLVVKLVSPTSSSLVQAAGLFALSEMKRRGVPVEFSPTVEQCRSKHPRVRIGAHFLAYAKEKSCAGKEVTDLILHDSDARVRQLAARAVFAKEPTSHALSVCAQYEPRRVVQKECVGVSESSSASGTMRAPLGRLQFELRLPMVRGPARLMPVAFWEELGPRISMSDRNGNVIVPANLGEIADPWWAY